MTQRTGRSVGGAALLAIVVGALGTFSTWIVGGGLQGRVCILAGVVMAVAMFIVQLIGVLAAARR
ncbi:hypothetical protein [Streptomyces cuspidosporus]|uniref:hypothetical protein n=1 Tax=Streptomyces cuspidosporus TaxID=66882 RepID=UPI0031FD0202